MAKKFDKKFDLFWNMNNYCKSILCKEADWVLRLSWMFLLLHLFLRLGDRVSPSAVSRKRILVNNSILFWGNARLSLKTLFLPYSDSDWESLLQTILNWQMATWDDVFDWLFIDLLTNQIYRYKQTSENPSHPHQPLLCFDLEVNSPHEPSDFNINQSGCTWCQTTGSWGQGTQFSCQF